jgi:hypothetical protein
MVDAHEFLRDCPRDFVDAPGSMMLLGRAIKHSAFETGNGKLEIGNPKFAARNHFLSCP